jgi:predicted metalloprotease with PDZ domain
MVGRLSAEGAEVHGARSATGLRTRLTRGNEDSDVLMKFKDDHPRNSDHYSFVQRRIPYLMIDTREHADYHRPTDDIERLNFDGLVRMTQLLCNLTQNSARETTPPFRRECLHEAHRQRPLMSVKQRFGISWSDREAAEPLVVTEIVPDSAAARAGLQVGDVVVQFGGQPPGSTAEFRETVAEAIAPIAVVVQRDGSTDPISIEVELDGHPKNWGIAAGIDPVEPGVLAVTSVSPRSPAAAAEIKPGDRILEQRAIETQQTGVEDAATVLEQCRVLVERDGRLSWRTLPAR